MSEEFWFARRYPVGRGGFSMAPIHWKGWALVGAFVGLDLIGTAMLAILAMNGELAAGAALFVSMLLIGGGFFVFFAATKGDRDKTVADYKGMKR